MEDTLSYGLRKTFQALSAPSLFPLQKTFPLLRSIAFHPRFTSCSTMMSGGLKLDAFLSFGVRQSIVAWRWTLPSFSKRPLLLLESGTLSGIPREGPSLGSRSFLSLLFKKDLLAHIKISWLNKMSSSNLRSDVFNSRKSSLWFLCYPHIWNYRVLSYKSFSSKHLKFFVIICSC